MGAFPDDPAFGWGGRAVYWAEVLDFEPAWIEGSCPVGDVLGLVCATGVARIDGDGEEATGSEALQGLSDGLQGGGGLGDAAFV